MRHVVDPGMLRLLRRGGVREPVPVARTSADTGRNCGAYGR